ncbi:MAG TPA: peptidylprolyl isomerase [Rhizobiaceae bacterium]
MSRHEVPRIDPAPPPKAVMMDACKSGACGCGSGGGGRAPEPPPPSFSTVRVNGVEIDPEAISLEMQHHPAPDAEGAWRAAARALALRELLLQEARRLDIADVREIDDSGRSETEDEALVTSLLEASVEPDSPEEIECRRYYELNRDRFRTPDLFEASHILIEPQGSGDDAWSAAGIEARRIARAVGDDHAAFAAAARECSTCPSAQQDGSLGQVRRGELVPEVQEAIEALAPGETGRRPVRSRFGWHVLRLIRRIEGRPLPYEAVRDKITDMMEARAWTLAAARYVARLSATADIEGVVLNPEDGT